MNMNPSNWATGPEPDWAGYSRSTPREEASGHGAGSVSCVRPWNSRLHISKYLDRQYARCFGGIFIGCLLRAAASTDEFAGLPTLGYKPGSPEPAGRPTIPDVIETDMLTAVENGGAGRSKMVALGGVDLP
jgi:hypothetical protein